MARAPFNVLVYPYIRVGDREFEYALLKRTDLGMWHTVAGGGEDNETPLEAARRETYEETGISMDSEFLRLDTVVPIPVIEFKVGDIWSDDIYIVPQYCFGVLAKDKIIVLSNEHTEFKWLGYEEARKLVNFDDNKTALWELNQRLRGFGPRG